MAGRGRGATTLPDRLGRLALALLIGWLAAGPTRPAEAAPSPTAASSGLLATDRADPVRIVYPSQSRIEERSFYSLTLDRTMPYFIYVPPGYDATDRRYPVAYMLHGMGGSNT